MLALIAALVAATVTASPAPTPTPRSFTPAMASQINTYGTRLIHEHRSPGLAIGVIENGRVVYERGFGYATIASRVAFLPSTQFDAGEISRSFAAASALILQQDGKLKIDNTIAAYLRSPFDSKSASQLIEKASGVPYSDFLQQRIFAPLVMDQTVLAGDNGASNLATGYTGYIGRFTRIMKAPEPADVITSVIDLEKWDLDFPILLRVDAVRDMFTAASYGPQKVQLGMGWHIDQRGGKRFIWQNADVPGFRAMNAMLPDDHIAVIVATNADDERDGRVAAPETVASKLLDVIDPPQEQQLSNVIVTRATDWLARLADGRIDRTQLTPEFSAYLTDTLLAKENIASLGKLQSIVPVASFSGDGGDTVYEFIVRFSHDTFHYRFAVAPDGKIDSLVLVP